MRCPNYINSIEATGFLIELRFRFGFLTKANKQIASSSFLKDFYLNNYLYFHKKMGILYGFFSNRASSNLQLVI